MKYRPSYFQGLLVANTSLNDGQREALIAAAYELHQDRKKRDKFKDEDIEGLITTEYKTATSPGFRGYIFQAEFEGEHGKASAKFVVDYWLLEMDPEQFYAAELEWVG